MPNLVTAVRRLLSWLAETQYHCETPLTLRDWADLPPHHPGT
ncbi:MAG: hypothetical protein ABIY37_02515 [Devosia sp.]